MKRLLLLARSLFLNETFDSAGGVVLGTNLSLASGLLTAIASAGARTCAFLTPPATIGRTYRTTLVISARTAGTVTPRIGGATGTARGVAGTYVEDLVATTTAAPDLNFTSTAAMSVESFTVERV